MTADPPVGSARDPGQPLVGARPRPVRVPGQYDLAGRDAVNGDECHPGRGAGDYAIGIGHWRAL